MGSSLARRWASSCISPNTQYLSSHQLGIMQYPSRQELGNRENKSLQDAGICRTRKERDRHDFPRYFAARARKAEPLRDARPGRSRGGGRQRRGRQRRLARRRWRRPGAPPGFGRGGRSAAAPTRPAHLWGLTGLTGSTELTGLAGFSTRSGQQCKLLGAHGLGLGAATPGPHPHCVGRGRLGAERRRERRAHWTDPCASGGPACTRGGGGGGGAGRMHVARRRGRAGCACT
jgi:hypothetical protein